MENRFKSHQVLAHRGFWDSDIEENSPEAIYRAADFGFGIETDLRNDASGVWISHDARHLENRTDASFIFDLGVCVALNIKSDGLSHFGLRNLAKIASTGSFFFDGSIPQMLDFRRKGLPHALRLSEYEKTLPWTPNYIWLDSFESDWWLDNQDIFDITPGVGFVIVSSELHGRAPEAMWNYIHRLDVSTRDRVRVCTDKPIEFMQWEI